MRVIAGSRHVARKAHTCNACEWIENVVVDDLYYYKFTYAELREIVKARRNRWRIMPGQEYVRQVQIYDNGIYTWRAIPAIHAICLKHDIYEYV